RQPAYTSFSRIICALGQPRSSLGLRWRHSQPPAMSCIYCRTPCCGSCYGSARTPCIASMWRELIHSLRETTEALRNGELVCIFPEGQMTRIGQMLPFRRGMERIVKGVDVPIIPVYLGGVWGSVFSFERGRFLWKMPRRIPYPVTVLFGEPMPVTTSAQEVRHAVQELGAET